MSNEKGTKAPQEIAELGKSIHDGLMSRNHQEKAVALRKLSELIESGHVQTLGVLFMLPDGHISSTMSGTLNESVYYKVHLMLDHIDRELKAVTDATRFVNFVPVFGAN